MMRLNAETLKLERSTFLTLNLGEFLKKSFSEGFFEQTLCVNNQIIKLYQVARSGPWIFSGGEESGDVHGSQSVGNERIGVCGGETQSRWGGV